MNTAAAIRTLPAGLLFAFMCSCSDRQSTLDPTGEEAQSIHTLFLVMTSGAVVIWLLVVGLMLHAMRTHRRPHREEGSQALILWGGAVFPSVVLLALLTYVLWLMPNIRPWFESSAAGPRIEVTGEQYWWRVRYLDSEGKPLFETANEVRLPAGQETVFVLRARDVIHSFWIPSLGGKMDMIPGRTNSLSLKPTRPGAYRGPCAEFCGTSHTLMAITAVVIDRPDYDAWIAARMNRTSVPGSEGAALFVKHGCPACHAIDGTDARGRIGPDLTALAERETIGAGTLANTPENIARFIRNPAAIKPGATMPAFDMLPPAEVDALAAWLGGLE